MEYIWRNSLPEAARLRSLVSARSFIPNIPPAERPEARLLAREKLLEGFNSVNGLLSDAVSGQLAFGDEKDSVKVCSEEGGLLITVSSSQFNGSQAIYTFASDGTEVSYSGVKNPYDDDSMTLVLLTARQAVSVLDMVQDLHNLRLAGQEI